LLVGYLMKSVKFCASTNELGGRWEIQSLLSIGRETGQDIDTSKRWETKEEKLVW